MTDPNTKHGKDGDPLGGIATDRYSCNSCESKANDPDSSHTFIKNGSAYRHYCKQQNGWTRLLPEPAVRVAMARAVRQLMKYDNLHQTIKVDPQAVVKLADRLEAGGGRE